MKVKDGLRLDGVLSVTRAIGGVQFKKSGLSAEPEVTRFKIHEDDSVLILATDGVLGGLSTNETVETVTRLIKKGYGYGDAA